MLADRARACLRRLDALQNADESSESLQAAAQLTEIIAHGSPEAAAQADLYAMVRHYDLLRAFITGEIAERLSSFNYSFTVVDMNAFFTRYRLENPQAAAWTDATLVRLKSTLSNCLSSVGMLDSLNAGNLSPLMLDFQVEALMRANGDADLAAALSGMGAM